MEVGGSSGHCRPYSVHEQDWILEDPLSSRPISGHSEARPRLSPGPKAKAEHSTPPPTTPRETGKVPSSCPTDSVTSRTRLRSLSTLKRAHDQVAEDLRMAEALIKRLKREGDKSALSSRESTRMLSDLKHSEWAAKASAPSLPNAGLFKSICSTDLLFLVDTTGSMRRYIDAAMDQVRRIVSDMTAKFNNEAEVRLAVVGYKDHNDDPNIEFLDFTTSVSTVHSFLGELEAYGGDDAPEDVLGGLRQALDASWKHKTRIIIHIADAPPHGTHLHDLNPAWDMYAAVGSEPHRLTHRPLLARLVQSQINYVLLRINETTDRMVYEFLQAHGAVAAYNSALLPANRYHSQVVQRKMPRAAGKLLFRELELVTTFDALQRLVVESATASAEETAVRHVSRIVNDARARPSPGRTTIISESGETDSELSEITPITQPAEDGGTIDPSLLDSSTPHWDSLSWFTEKISIQGFTIESIIKGDKTLDGMVTSDANFDVSVMDLKIHKRKAPFSKGALRLAFYARTTFSTNRYVVKTFQRSGKTLPDFTEGMHIQALCKSFAIEFNSLLDGKHTIDFLTTACFEFGSSAGAKTSISLEPFIEGTYVKYNNNIGHILGSAEEPINQAAQAFSHFTFERSKGQFLVCDLQGVGEVMTDPAIHTASETRFKLSRTNLGIDGMKLFFLSHRCNDQCRQLGLLSNSTTLFSTDPVFRKTWPPKPDDQVCCSNKLCRRILWRDKIDCPTAKATGNYWCDTCLPQLGSFLEKRICFDEDSTTHEFEVSRFVLESQGQAPPRRCPLHRKDDSPQILEPSAGGAVSTSSKLIWVK